MLFVMFGLISVLCALYGAWFAYDRFNEPQVALVALMLAIGLFAWTLMGARGRR